MYSTSVPYEDMPSTLLMIAMILSLSSLSIHKIEIFKQRKLIWWISAFWLACLINLLPSSPLRELYSAIPNQSHWEIRQELVEFDKLSKDDSIAVQTSLGPQFNRTNISAITQDRNGNCAPLRRGRLMKDTKYLVFAKSLNHYLIDDLEECISIISTSPDYKMLHGFRHLYIFKKFK